MEETIPERQLSEDIPIPLTATEQITSTIKHQMCKWTEIVIATIVSTFLLILCDRLSLPLFLAVLGYMALDIKTILSRIQKIQQTME